MRDTGGTNREEPGEGRGGYGTYARAVYPDTPGTLDTPDETAAQALRTALARLRRTAAVPVAFAGVQAEGSGFRISELSGTHGHALRGLTIAPGNGLGGKALARARPASVLDYRVSRVISHEYDAAVAAEGLCSVLAVPLVVRRQPRGVLYAALRQPLALGDRVVDTAVDAVRELEQTLAVHDEVQQLLAVARTPAAASQDPAVWEEVRAAHAELRTLAHRLPDDAERRALLAVCARLAAACTSQSLHGASAGGDGVTDSPTGSRTPGAGSPPLSPRETDVIACAADGSTNTAIATRTGLRPETVKSYLRSAMRKLDTHTRLGAVVAARRAGLIP